MKPKIHPQNFEVPMLSYSREDISPTQGKKNSFLTSFITWWMWWLIFCTNWIGSINIQFQDREESTTSINPPWSSVPPKVRGNMNSDKLTALSKYAWTKITRKFPKVLSLSQPHPCILKFHQIRTRNLGDNLDNAFIRVVLRIPCSSNVVLRSEWGLITC